jgi:VWFA-related protein
MTVRLCVRRALGLTFFCTLCFAAEAPEPRLLDFNIVAVNGQGQPVNDLGSSDFEVTDAGKRQNIVLFRHDGGELRQAEALAPNEYSNRRGNPTRVTVVLFDLMNERFSTRGVTANQIVHDLQGIETSGNLYLYFLTLEGRLFAVHGFSQPEQSSPGQEPWTKQIKPLMDAALRAVLRTRPVDIDVAVRVQLTLNALDSLAAQLAMFPGRKNVVWVTDGIPIELGPARSDTGDFVDFTPQLRQLSEAFDRSGAAIYPVQQIMLGSPDAMGGGSGIGSHMTLDELAGLTGGRPTGSKDVGAAVRQAMNDARGSYQIGYYPPAGNWDGKFHKLKITSKRKNVRLQARTGYYAWPEEAGARAERAVDAAINSPFDDGEIGIRGALIRDADNPQKGHLTLHIDAHDVGFAQDGDRYLGQLRLDLITAEASGKIVNSKIVPLDVHYTAAERDKALQAGIGIAQDVTLATEVTTLRFIAFDRNSNSLGSLTIPLRASAAAGASAASH